MLFRYWRVWRALQPLQQKILIQSWALFPILVLALRLFSYRRVYRALLQYSANPASPVATAAHPQVGELARAVQIAAAHSLVPVVCLPRSLMLWWQLRRYGYESALRFGVRKNQGAFEAHAWVKFRNTVLLDPETIEQSYVLMDDFLSLPRVRWH